MPLLPPEGYCAMLAIVVDHLHHNWVGLFILMVVTCASLCNLNGQQKNELLEARRQFSLTRLRSWDDSNSGSLTLSVLL